MLTPLCVHSSGLYILKMWGSKSLAVRLESLRLPIAGLSGSCQRGPDYDTVAADLNSGPQTWVAYALPTAPSFQPVCGYDLSSLWTGIISLVPVLAFLKESWFGLKGAGWFFPIPQLISRSQHQPLRYTSEIPDLSEGRIIVLVQWTKKIAFQTQLFRGDDVTGDSPSLGSGNALVLSWKIQ